MKKSIILFLCVILLAVLVFSEVPAQKEYRINGLSEPVKILKDRWGISHIYAKNQKDLFFAQGFNVARDRLFQLELWRRKASGTLSEILGLKALKSDIGSRLLRARVDMNQEMSHYHPDGAEIITSFVKGINAYIALTRKKPELLPLEFRLLGLTPGRWSPDIVVSRHNGLFRNARDEVGFSRLLQVMDADTVKSLIPFHPGDPDLERENILGLSSMPKEVLDLYLASRSPVPFGSEDIVDPAARAAAPSAAEHKKQDFGRFSFLFPGMDALAPLGSNNWVVSGRKTFTGRPFMANDPHRSQQLPSLRYWVHLNAPGWNVIGGGEPALPGVSIGHNAFGAWGLTIFSVDQEDLYVYETDPQNPNRYKYRQQWKNMTVIRDTIPVKGRRPVPVELKYTRHGPVLFEDISHHKAYALRAAWLEAGCAPYLASLRMDQARNWEEFRDACAYSRTPSENMVWADRENNIGWQAVGIAPLRKNWSGLLPVSGDGRFEWDGFLPIKSLPHIANPEQGFFASANEDNIPEGYPYSVGFLWTDPFRAARLMEVLSSGRKLTMRDMMSLQQDVFSLPARSLVPLLNGLKARTQKARKAVRMLLSWDLKMTQDSAEAALYSAWEKRLSEKVWNLFVPEEVRRYFRRRSLVKMIDLLTAPDGHFGKNPEAGRNDLLLESLKLALADVEKRLGPDMQEWRYGQPKFHHIQIHHPLSRAVTPELQETLDTPVLSRGGNRFTVNMTTSFMNQTSGASFRIIADLANWDYSLGTNAPGQSGDPNSPHYTDLFAMLSKGTYFPVFFSKAKIDSVTELTLLLQPEARKPETAVLEKRR